MDYHQIIRQHALVLTTVPSLSIVWHNRAVIWGISPVKDYYKILELSHDASQEDIKNQWRFFVQAWHPDKFANLDYKRRAEEKFMEVTEAYEVLRHPESRQAYNALRAEEEHQRKAQAARAVQKRKREELHKQEEPARNRVREEQQQIEHV